MRSFKHSGDLGDIIYSLPAIRVVGGGTLYFSKATFARTQPSPATVANAAPLLEAQSYIKAVKLYTGQGVAYDLDAFRFIPNDCTNIAVRHLRAFGLPESEVDRQWLECEPKAVAPVVINLTTRYQNELFPWGAIRGRYQKQAVFVGTASEHASFCAFYGKIDYYPTKTLLDLAQVINGAKLFIGNQSCPCAIAEGLKKPLIQEVCLHIHNCMFNRPDAQYVAGERIGLPDV